MFLKLDIPDEYRDRVQYAIDNWLCQEIVFLTSDQKDTGDILVLSMTIDEDDNAQK